MDRILGPAALAAASALLAGCRAYEPSPLDLDGHRARLDARVLDVVPVADFAARLAAHEAGIPARFDPADGLSAAEGEVLALFHNPDLRLARLEAGLALADAETAGSWSDPVLGFDAAQVLSPSSLFEYGVTLGLTIPLSGRLEAERARAEAGAEAALRRVVEAEWDQRAAVRRDWVHWTLAVERTRLATELLDSLEGLRDVADRLERAGELSRVETRLVRAEALAQQAVVAESRLAAHEAELALRARLGLTADAPVTLEPGLPVPAAPHVDDPATRMLAASPTLAVRRAAYRTAEAALRREIRAQYPDLELGGGYGDEGDDRLLLGLAIPLPVLNGNRAGIAEAEQRRELARAAAETTLERLLHALARTRARLESARARRAAFEAELVPLLDAQAVELVRLAELGELNVPLLLETATRREAAARRLLSLRETEAEAAIELARLLGPDAPREPAPVDGPPSEPAPLPPDSDADGGAR